MKNGVREVVKTRLKVAILNLVELERAVLKGFEFDLRFEKSVYLPNALLRNMHGQLA